MTGDLADALTRDLADAGLAEQLGEGELKSLSSEDVLKVEQNGDVVELFENGDSILELNTQEVDFNERFIAAAATSLNF